MLVRVYDRGPEPEWHRDRSLCGPWWRFEAELPDQSVVNELGMSPWEAVYRLVALSARGARAPWAEVPADQRDRRSDAVFDFGEWRVPGASEPRRRAVRRDGAGQLDRRRPSSAGADVRSAAA